MKTSSKIRQTDILDEQYEIKNYLREFTPEIARVKYRQRYSMIKEAKLKQKLLVVLLCLLNCLQVGHQ